MKTPFSARTAAIVALVALACVTAGCDRQERTAAKVSPAEGRRYVEDFFDSYGNSADMSEGLYRTLDEVTPNVAYVRPSGRSVVATHVVVGHITDVTKGKGFRVEGADAPGGTATDFADARAKWWTVHATVAVDHGIASSTPEQVTVMFPSAGPADFAKMQAGLKALGQVVLFLRDDSPLTAYDRNLYWAVQDFGVLVATVSADGTLALPLLTDQRAAKLLAKTPKLSDLETSAKTPRAIPIVGTPGSPDVERRADGL
jgi:hypothetical protein